MAFQYCWFFYGLIAMIFCNEGHMRIGNVEQTLIANGHPVPVLAKVRCNVFGLCHGWLTKYDPLGIPSFLQEMIKPVKGLFFL